ncbi:MAG: hypothetical protein KJ904_01480 [Alphaproteobacteria bacterium]|nr:hypothetical protein [Alphaproteobacteria bacterium]MBU0796827.1 hypothetical protein [Alphaproteobacteria bacterium]MBU0885815.1 hypothetical protein [Alphaproteobacteria bacterium]MBU1812108.1 hypothetical protein [Alphaproteobacteria bacterium]MBU2090944.1 hypothetical protein [Alphaproteobacteria bacterium]
MAVAILSLAVPRLLGAATGHQAAGTLWSLRAGAVLEPAVLSQAAQRLDRASRFSGDPKGWLDAGYLSLQGQAQSGEPDAGQSLAEARRLTAQGLAGMPGHASGWSRLAYLRAEAGDYPSAAQAVRLSMLAGRVPPGLIGDRVRLGLGLLPWLDAEGLTLLSSDVRNSWILDTRHISQAVQTQAQADFIARALEGLTEEDKRQFLRVRGLVK